MGTFGHGSRWVTKPSASMFIISPSGGDFPTLTSWAARMAALGQTGPFVVSMMPGVYNESPTLPANTTVYGEGEVEITGTVTLTNDADLAARLVNLTITPAAGNAGISADFSAAALANSPLEIFNVQVDATGAGTAILVANVQLFVDDLDLSAATGIGLSVEPSDGAGEETVVRGGRIRIVVSGAGVAWSNLANAVGDDRVSVQVDDVTLDLTNGAVGLNHASNGAIVEASQGNGFRIGAVYCRGQGAAINTFIRPVAANGQHNIGSVQGQTISDLVIDQVDGELVVGQLLLPAETIGGRDTFQAAVIQGGVLQINGGVIEGGTDVLFEQLGDAEVTLRNIIVTGLQNAGQVYELLAAAAATNATEIIIDNCNFRYAATAAAGTFIFEGGGVTNPTIVLTSVGIAQAGDALTFA